LKPSKLQKKQTNGKPREALVFNITNNCPPNACNLMVNPQPRWIIKSIFGNHHTLLKVIQHDVTIAICCFFVSAVLCAHHKKIRYLFARANNKDDEKIITLAPPTHNKNSNQSIMVTTAGRKWSGVQGR
jgi:hypothetical protein